jgi:hypothetical protein
MRVGLFILILGIGFHAAAQSIGDLREQQLSTQQTGMVILGSWAVLNLVSSPILAARTSGPTKYFHQMNGFWNTVNLGLAGFSLLSIARQNMDPTFNELLSEQLKLEKLLLFNAGLDIAYVAAGFYLRERSKNVVNNRDRFLGFGNSLLLQGGFLFLFDVGFYLAVHQHYFDIIENTSNFSVSLAPAGFGLSYRF